MSRYRRTDADLAYGDLPPGGPERWDTNRYRRETDRIRAPVIEERPPYRSGGGGGGGYYEDDRYYQDDRRYGPRGYEDRRYFEEDEYYDPRASSGAVIPYRPARPPRPGRPGLLRRQSSLDRVDFERRSSRRYDDYYRPPPPPPPPRDSRYERIDRQYYDDVRIQDPDYYGDDGFREYREREWTRSRARGDSPSPDRRTSRGGGEEVVEEKFEEKIEEKVEKPYPRRGKTKMPKRLVHTKVLFDLGYPYYELDEKTILIEKALGPENIDEIFAKSKEYRERETITTRLIEAPPSSGTTIIDHKSETEHISRPGTVIDEHKSTFEEVRTKPLSEAPRSVREWDGLSKTRSISPKSSVSHRSRRSRSHAAKSRRSSSSSSSSTTILEEKKIIEKRSSSPARTHRSHRSRRSHGTSFSGTEIIERKRIIEEDVGGIAEESNSIGFGPLALVEQVRNDRTDDDIQREIRRLERERRDLRRERSRGAEVVRIERGHRDSGPILMEPEARGEIIIERRGEELVEVRKDRRDRARSRSRPPSADLLKAMMYTVT